MKKQIIIISIILFITVQLVYSGEYIEKAFQESKNKNYRQAIKLYKKAIDNKEQPFKAYASICLIYIMLEEYKEALNYGLKAENFAQSNEEKLLIYQEIAQCYSKGDNIDRAIDYALKTLKMDKNDFWGNYYLALSYLRKSHEYKYLKLDDALRLSTTDECVAFSTRMKYLKKGKTYIKEALNIRPNSDLAKNVNKLTDNSIMLMSTFDLTGVLFLYEKVNDIILRLKELKEVHQLYVSQNDKEISEGLKEIINAFEEDLKSRKERHEKKARESFNAKKYNEAIIEYEKASKIDPKNVNYLHDIGSCYVILGEHKNGIKYYKKALAIDPKYSLAYKNLGLAYNELGEYNDAIEAFNKLIKIDSKNPVGYRNRAIAYKNLNKYNEAIKDFDKAIKYDSDNAFAYYQRGDCYHNLSEFEKAISDSTKAIKLNPKYAECYVLRGNCHIGLQKYKKAIEDFNKAIKINSKYDWAYNRRGISYYNLEKYKDSIASYNKAIKIDPKYYLYYYNRGNSYFALEQYTKAMSDYTTAIKLNPNHTDSYIFRGNCYLDSNQ